MESKSNQGKHSVKIGGRVFPLAFPLKALIDMRKSINGFDFNEIDKLLADPNMLLPILFILADNGALLNGEKMDVNQDWFALHISANVKRIMAIQLAMIETITDGMNMDIEEDEEIANKVNRVLAMAQSNNEPAETSEEESEPITE